MVEYLSFSVRERWAVLMLVLFIGIVFMAPRFISMPDKILVVEDSLIIKALPDLDTASINPAGKPPGFRQVKKYTEPPSARFYFDPNTIDKEQWVSLGVREKTAITILKYRQHGGRFKSADDLGKIYGLTPELAEQLKPFVRIAQKELEIASQKPVNFTKRPGPVPIKINQADSIAWESLPGIGPALAARIIGFRNRLGGFYSVNQVSEVYGLQDSVFQKLVPFLLPDEQPLQTLDINTASQEQLASHPYIRKSIAQAIVQYRAMHGRFLQVNDLTKIHLIGPDNYKRISRYCKIE